MADVTAAVLRLLQHITRAGYAAMPLPVYPI